MRTRCGLYVHRGRRWWYCRLDPDHDGVHVYRALRR